MLKKMLFASFVVIVTLLFNVKDVSAQTVSIDNVEAAPGDQIAVAVRLNNNTHDISGLLIPLRFPGSAMTVDSVSFVNSFITSDYLGGANIIEDSNVVRISYLLSNFMSPKPISSPNGTIATIFFTLSENVIPGSFVVDSVNSERSIGNGITAETKVHLSDPAGLMTYYPDFVEGSVLVKIPTDVEDFNNSTLPNSFELAQNYPNPFNPMTTIEFALPYASDVNLEVFNVLGQKVVTLVESNLPAGIHQIDFEAGNQPSGMYFYRLIHDNGSETKKMVLIK